MMYPNAFQKVPCVGKDKTHSVEHPDSDFAPSYTAVLIYGGLGLYVSESTFGTKMTTIVLLFLLSSI